MQSEIQPKQEVMICKAVTENTITHNTMNEENKKQAS